MSAFIRIELHEISSTDRPNGEVYSRLHALLASKSIKREVPVTDVGVKTLPSGTYFTEASDKNAIGQDVHWAAKQTGYPYSHLIVISNGSIVYNLDACK